MSDLDTTKGCVSMGIFDFLIRPRKNQSTSFSVDFLTKCGATIRNAEVTFGSSSRGTFLINGEEEQFVGGYVDDLGMSSDLKYRKVGTKYFGFWISPNDFPLFWKKIKLLQAECQPKTALSNTTFEDYIGCGQTFFEIPVRFNASGVSHDFGVPAKEIISRFSQGDVVTLVYHEDESCPDESIALLDSKGHQFGWYPLSEGAYPEVSEIVNQVKAGIPLTAKVVETGQVYGKPYYWCCLECNIKIPYPKDEQKVYVAASGYLYHANPKCNKRIVKDIPISWAVKNGMSPCTKCFKKDDGDIAD